MSTGSNEEQNKQANHFPTVIDPAKLQASLEDPEESEAKDCPYCAETVKAKAIKCKHCGSKLDSSSQLIGDSVSRNHLLENASAKRHAVATTTGAIGAVGAVGVGFVMICVVAAAGTVGWVLFPFLAFPIYFVPSVVAFVQKKNNMAAIAVLNLLLGWTVIGWIVALVWAMSKDNSVTSGAGNVEHKTLDDSVLSPKPQTTVATKVSREPNQELDHHRRQLWKVVNEALKESTINPEKADQLFDEAVMLTEKLEARDKAKILMMYSDHLKKGKRRLLDAANLWASAQVAGNTSESS